MRLKIKVYSFDDSEKDLESAEKEINEVLLKGWNVKNFELTGKQKLLVVFSKK